jgi:hypothetical protein
MPRPSLPLKTHRPKVPSREAALAKLGIRLTDVWQKPRITPHIDELRIALQKLSFTTGEDLNLPPSLFDLLQASDDPDARKVLEKYYSIPEVYRRRLDIESFCVAAEVPPLRILELIVGTIVRLNHHLSEAIASVASPAVVNKTVEMALTPEGTKDREMLHKATGFLPTPRGGPSVRVQVSQSQSQAAQASVVAAPSPVDVITRMVDRFNDARPIIPVTSPPQLGELPSEADDE